ncbi:hypothetical protein DERF_016710 [Dermatophagoides farinae]|uniref:Uncharacterized protein n=1 Tax=Dermatophagoides farinae TaxID=6954 RepID=A0A922HL44_DERFA|nr:hypothetical protein DERF_016710 [Dermatophagoides farinae]
MSICSILLLNLLRIKIKEKEGGGQLLSLTVYRYISLEMKKKSELMQQVRFDFYTWKSSILIFRY